MLYSFDSLCLFQFTLIISTLGSTSLLCTRQFLLAVPIFCLALRSLAFPQHHCQWHWTIWTCNLLFIWEKSNGKIFFFLVPRFWARKIPPSQLLNVLNQGDHALWSWLPSSAWSTSSPAVPHLAVYEVSLFPHFLLHWKWSRVEKWKKQGVKSKEGEQKQLGIRIREKLAEERLLKKKDRKERIFYCWLLDEEG